MAQPGSSEEREQQLNTKLDQIYARVQKKFPKGVMAEEATEYYEQAQRFRGDDKLYYMRLLASMLEEY